MSSIKNQLETLATSMRKELKIDIVPGWEMEEDVEKMATPSLQLTAKTGGMYRGRIHHFVGQEHAQKSTYVLQTCAMDNQPWFILDVEGSITESYMDALGIDRDRIIYVPAYKPENKFEAFDIICKKFSSQPIFGGCMIDSLNALVPKKVDDEGIETHNIGLFAKMLNKHIKSANGRYKKNNIAAFYLDQFRTDIGKMLGDNRMATGGKAMQYYSSMTLWLTRSKIQGEKWEESKLPKYQVNMSCKKDKLNPLWGKVSIPIDEHLGFDRVGDMIAVVNLTPHFTKTGNTYKVGETKLGVGKKQVQQYFEDNPEHFVEVQRKIANDLNNPIILEEE